MTNSIKEARKKAGITQKQMSDLLAIPKRNIENWESGKNSPPKWAENLILDKLRELSG